MGHFTAMEPADRQDERDAIHLRAALADAGISHRWAGVRRGGEVLRTHVVHLDTISPTLHAYQVSITVDLRRGTTRDRVDHALRHLLTRLGKRLDAVERHTGRRQPIPLDGIRTEVGHLRVERHSLERIAAGHRSFSEGLAWHVADLNQQTHATSGGSDLGNHLIDRSKSALEAQGTRVWWHHGIIAGGVAALHGNLLSIHRGVPEQAAMIMAGRHVRDVVEGLPVGGIDDYQVRSASTDGEWLRLKLIPDALPARSM